jgi:hypothetical protein
MISVFFRYRFTIDASVGLFHFSRQMDATFFRRFYVGWFLLFLFVPVLAQAQFTYSTNNSEISVTSYTGPGGAVSLPDFVGIYPVTTIGMTAFFGKTAITSITFNTNLTTIGYNAFGGCSSLTSLTIPNSVTNIGQYAFEPCIGLTNITLPNQLDKIQSETFGNCGSLTSIIIPASVTNIGSAAFDLCSSLTAIYFLGNQPTPGANMFHGVNASAIVYYLAGTLGWSASYGILPTVMLSRGLEITSAGEQNNDFAFIINGTNGQVVVVQAATNIMNATWQPLTTNTLSSTVSNFTDVNWKNYPRRFYRLYSP